MVTAIIPNENDVLLGRGAIINSHPGNQHFRSLVASQRDTFIHSPLRRNKRGITLGIIASIQGLSPPGRFLVEAKEPTTSSRNNEAVQPVESKINLMILEKTWVQVDDDRALSKVMHRLREREKGSDIVNKRKHREDPESDASDEAEEEINEQLKRRMLEHPLYNRALNQYYQMQQLQTLGNNNPVPRMPMHIPDYINLAPEQRLMQGPNNIRSGLLSLPSMHSLPNPLGQGLQAAVSTVVSNSTVSESTLASMNNRKTTPDDTHHQGFRRFLGPTKTTTVFESLDEDSLQTLIQFRRAWRGGDKKKG